MLWNVVAVGVVFVMSDIRSIHYQTDSAIGIITDSHGQMKLLSRSIQYLQENQCETIIHLGDICDSVNIHTADQCISLIQNHKIIAIRGNNDHALSFADTPEIDQTTRDYIRSLPLVVQNHQLFFTHSVPFVNELGLSCMIQNLNSRFIKLCFDSLGKNAILFRGHSHKPEIIVHSNKGYQRTAMNFPVKKNLNDLCPCVITCGTVMNGQCMIYYPNDRVLLGCLIIN
jgi:predicted phosphodiesterase